MQSLGLLQALRKVLPLDPVQLPDELPSVNIRTVVIQKNQFLLIVFHEVRDFAHISPSFLLLGSALQLSPENAPSDYFRGWFRSLCFEIGHRAVLAQHLLAHLAPFEPADLKGVAQSLGDLVERAVVLFELLRPVGDVGEVALSERPRALEKLAVFGAGAFAGNVEIYGCLRDG